MTPRSTEFHYQAWPTRGMPHVEALHHLFGMGVAEIRIDTYILAPNRPQWLIILRGGTSLEIKVRARMHGPVSSLATVVKSSFPLRGSVSSALQDAFPAANLPDQIVGPADLISWLSDSASVCTVSKRIIHFYRARESAEVTHVNVRGRCAETFSLKSNRLETVMDTLAMLPAPRLPDMDYGAWLQRAIAPLPERIALPPPTAHNDDTPQKQAPNRRVFRFA